MKDKGTLNTRGLMDYLNTGRNNAQQLMRKEGFPSVQITPRRRVVSVEALERWLADEARKKENE